MTMDTQETTEKTRIRAIFLDRKKRYSFPVAVRLLGMTEAALLHDVASGSVETEREGDGSYCFTWPQLAFAALRRWPLRRIVEALERDAAKGLPEAVLPCPATFHLPRYQVDVIHALARREATDADTILSDYLLDLCESNAEELADDVPGLREAIRFPDEMR
jgi:hypothetical protein